MKTPATGRASIFRNKLPTNRVQGILSSQGMRLFEAARRRLATLADVPASVIAPRRLIEALVRGEEGTRRHLEEGRVDVAAVLVVVFYTALMGSLIWIGWLSTRSEVWRGH